MKIHEITKLFFESLDRPFPYTQISPSTWEITVPNIGSLIVTLDCRNINGYTIAHISFNVPNSGGGKPQLTDWFSNSGATGVFAAVIEIVKQYKEIDLMIFVPDDLVAKIHNKKVRLYMMMLNRMKRENYLVRVEQYDQLSGEVIQVGFPTGSRLWNWPNSDIESLLVDFLVDKSV